MFIIALEQGKSYYVPLIDFHTHIGKVKIETTKGKSQRVNSPQNIIQLYQKLHYELYKRINENKNEVYYEFPKVEDFVKPLNPIVQFILDSNKEKARGWLIDQIVTFPFNDIFHQTTTPKFLKSNKFVRHQTQSIENTFRFIPFCRVDPTDAGSGEEVRKSISLGMKGLKLHPLSQDWIDKINSEASREILKIAADLKIPVIFDVPNKGVAIDIVQLKENTHDEYGFSPNIILGHSGFDYSSKEIFECIAKENIFVEISGMRGKDVEIFFSNVMNIENWYQKILFGSDHNYFSVLQAADFITFLFTKKFHFMLEEVGLAEIHHSIISQILGFNAIKLLPQFWEHSIPDQSSNIKYFCKFSDLYVFLRKFLTQESCYASLDVVSIEEEKKITNILTLGREKQTISFQLDSDYKQKEIILSPAQKEYKKINEFSLNSYYSQFHTNKFKKRRLSRKISLEEIFNLFNHR